MNRGRETCRGERADAQSPQLLFTPIGADELLEESDALRVHASGALEAYR